MLLPKHIPEYCPKHGIPMEHDDPSSGFASDISFCPVCAKEESPVSDLLRIALFFVIGAAICLLIVAVGKHWI